jgi:hypothetical protein
MKAVWRKTLLATLSLAGVLMMVPDADARSRHHKHEWRDRHCRPQYNDSWRDRGRYNDYYDRGRRGWYSDRRRPYYGDDYYPSRYPYRPYYDRSYYGDFPWGSIFYDR